MRFSREWAMPNSETFSIPPIRCLLKRYIEPGMVVIDPFARNSKIGTITNDLNPETTAEYHLDATEFLAGLVSEGVRADVVLFDPPYSLTQVARSYQDIGLKFKGDENPTGGFPEARSLIARLLRPGGVAICCGWNTVGIGIKHLFDLLEVLDVCHGGNRNDTLVTVERKMQAGLFQ